MPRVDQLFELRYGHGLELNRLEQVAPPAGVNFVGRSSRHNGVTGRVISPVVPAAAGELTVALSASPLATFVQPAPFVTAFHVMILSPRDPQMTTLQKLWWARCIAANQYRFSYGRQANRTLGRLLLPDVIPEWVEMAPWPDLSRFPKAIGEVYALTRPSEWMKFRVSDLFEIAKGARRTKRERGKGSVRFVGASRERNGIVDMSDVKPDYGPGVLTVPYNGNSVGWACYQDAPFACSDDVNVLIPKSQDADKYSLLFVAAVLRYERYRFTYGFKWNIERMANSVIRLPATLAGDVDWVYMSRYMQGLPYSAAVEGLGEVGWPSAPEEISRAL